MITNMALALLILRPNEWELHSRDKRQIVLVNQHRGVFLNSLVGVFPIDTCSPLWSRPSFFYRLKIRRAILRWIRESENRKNK